ncbi:beta-N-acetylhexosaminidase [Trifolium repens]|nr:beta-N-acetylhexosaminidase [Trifolium repens]
MFQYKPRILFSPILPLLFLFFFLLIISFASKIKHHRDSNNNLHHDDEPLTYLWQLPSQFSSGNYSLSIDPSLTVLVIGNLHTGKGFVRKLKERIRYHIVTLNIIVHSNIGELKLGVDESYTLQISTANESSVAGNVTIEANTVFGALRGLETFSQLCSFDYTTKTVKIHKAPWSIQDKPRFAYRGLMLDTSRHYLPINVIKQVIESMSYAKLTNIMFYQLNK